MFLEPTSIAIVGASPETQKLGHYILRNVLTQGFAGAVYPINPKHDEIMGRQAYTSISAVPETIDMVVVVTPASTVIDIARQCAEKGVKTLVVISAGFGEIGTKEGIDLERKLLQVCRKGGMRLIGPNCLGILRPNIGLNASFASFLPKKGPIALISQSGAMAVALLDRSSALGMRYSMIVSIGNKADMDECALLEVCEEDDETAVIGLYLESIKDGRRFMELARRIGVKKPIVLLKSGISKRGSLAVSSHTGALAGSGAAIDAVCRQTGIRRARTTDEFLDILRTLGSQPPLPSPRIAIITNAGGPGVLATDEAEKQLLELPTLSEATIAHLRSALPIAASTKNPIDIIGDALADRYDAALLGCVQDPNIDGAAVMLTPQVMTPVTEVAQAIVKLHKRHPLFPIVTSFMGSDSVRDASDVLARGDVPNFESPERAIRALASLRSPTLLQNLHVSDGREEERAGVAGQLLHSMNGLLDESVTEDLLEIYGLRLPDQSVVQSMDEARAFAQEAGYPLIAKISSPDILHKSDIGAVVQHIRSEKELMTAYDTILENCRKHAPSAGIRGILLQPVIAADYECIVGAVRDPSFGPLIMVGLGGIFTEVFRDTSFRIAPIDESDAYDMLTRLKSWRMLQGMRGKPAADIDSIVRTVVSVSQLMIDCPHVKELDLNPLLVTADATIVADAKVIVG